MQYVELHARSAFSFLEGAPVPEELAAACAGFEMPAIGPCWIAMAFMARRDSPCGKEGKNPRAHWRGDYLYRWRALPAGSRKIAGVIRTSAG